MYFLRLRTLIIKQLILTVITLVVLLTPSVRHREFICTVSFGERLRHQRYALIASVCTSGQVLGFLQ